MSLLFAKPRHARPQQLPGATAALVPVVLLGTSGSALGALAATASAADKPAARMAAATSPTGPQTADLLSERMEQVQRAELRAARSRAAAQDRAAEQAAADAAQAAAAQAAAAQAAAAEAAAKAEAEAAAAKARADAAASAQQQAPVSSTGGYTRPGVGPLTSTFGMRWGRMHTGIDLAAGVGAPVRAATAGVVVAAGYDGAYGQAVRLRHADGTETFYAHNSALLVGVGQRVGSGQQIAREGATGNVTGAHLHFEVTVGGRKIDPLPWLRARGVAV